MRNRSSTILALMGALLLPLATAADVAAQGKGGTGDPPVHLSLQVWDSQGRQSEPAAEDLARLVSELSDDSFTIDVTYDGGADLAQRVQDGTVQLAILATREWDAAGVTSMDAFEAPFLIHDDALALAVATSDIADRAMAGLDAVGVTGLALWPEDLRHLFAFGPSGKVFRTVEDVVGSDVLVVAGTPGHDLITTLGGNDYQEGSPSDELTGDRFTDADAGTLEGMVTGLWGAGLPMDDVVVAGDLVVYAKYQMLVANSAALTALTAGQRRLLDEAVARMHEAALHRHYTEAELAAERCSYGGTVVEAGPEALAALREAAQPLTDALAGDPLTGSLMADIAALDAATADAPGAGTCSPTVAQASSSAEPVAEYVATAPPHGSYRISVTEGDLVSAGARKEFAGLNAGTWTWSFSGGWWEAAHDVRDERCRGAYLAQADMVVFFNDSPTMPCAMAYQVRWAPEADGIRFQLLGLTGSPDATEAQLADERSFIDRTWTRIGDAPPPAADGGFIGTEPFPDGTYRAELSADDMVARGARREFAGVNTSTWTWTLDDGQWTLTGSARNERCTGSYQVVEEVVRVVDDPGGDCSQAGDYRWRLEGDGIRFQYLGLPGMSATDLQDMAAAMGRVWTRIE
jgi:TRAP-type C4-dicarboxylate transport system substrate-binding protein